jgi:hypothetical protein
VKRQIHHGIWYGVFVCAECRKGLVLIDKWLYGLSPSTSQIKEQIRGSTKCSWLLEMEWIQLSSNVISCALQFHGKIQRITVGKFDFL